MKGLSSAADRQYRLHMSSISFLACETTLPGSGERRGDAFEHDLMMAALVPAFAEEGHDLHVIDWEAPLEAFDGIDLVMLGTAWNYQDKASDFLTKLDALQAKGIQVCNSPQIVRWNVEKTYLRELAERGAATIPTLWLNDVSAQDCVAAMEQFQTDSVVVKRQVGAGALGQERVSRGSLPGAEWRFGHPAMVQPFLPAIASEGELSFIFIEGELSHCLLKRPANGEYRIQSLYGGTEEDHKATEEEETAAKAIVQALPFDSPLYARIDMLRMDNGALAVMEAELIEPFLYPLQGAELGQRLARAVTKRLAK